MPFFLQIFSLPWMLNTAGSSAIPLDTRGGSLSRWLVLLTWRGLPPLQWCPLCCLPLLSCGWERASAEALVLLASLLPFPEPGWGCCDAHHPRSPQVSSAHAGGAHLPSGALRSWVCGEASLRWDDVETSEGDETVAAAAVEFLFCSSGSCRRNNCHPCWPQHRQT